MAKHKPLNDKAGESSILAQGVPAVFLDIALNNRSEAMCVMQGFRMAEGNERCLEMFGYSREEFVGL